MPNPSHASSSRSRLRPAPGPITILVQATLAVLACAACAEADGPDEVQLVSHRETSLPTMRMRGSRDSALGPQIEIKRPGRRPSWQPDRPLEVLFSPGEAGQPVNMASLKVTYRKAWGIDITDRLEEYIVEDSIRVPYASLPAGDHEVEIYIEDHARNPTRKIVKISITE